MKLFTHGQDYKVVCNFCFQKYHHITFAEVYEITSFHNENYLTQELIRRLMRKFNEIQTYKSWRIISPFDSNKFIYKENNLHYKTTTYRDEVVFILSRKKNVEIFREKASRKKNVKLKRFVKWTTPYANFLNFCSREIVRVTSNHRTRSFSHIYKTHFG